MDESTPKELLLDLCRTLGLLYESQDWGIANADPDRVVEFIVFYEGATYLSPTQQHEMGELIIASMNDDLEEGFVDPTVRDKFVDFVAARRSEFQVVVNYWASLAAKDFPVAALLKIAEGK
jgi:hypothetical protein